MRQILIMGKPNTLEILRLSCATASNMSTGQLRVAPTNVPNQLLILLVDTVHLPVCQRCTSVTQFTLDTRTTAAQRHGTRGCKQAREAYLKIIQQTVHKVLHPMPALEDGHEALLQKSRRLCGSAAPTMVFLFRGTRIRIGQLRCSDAYMQSVTFV